MSQGTTPDFGMLQETNRRALEDRLRANFVQLWEQAAERRKAGLASQTDGELQKKLPLIDEYKNRAA